MMNNSNRRVFRNSILLSTALALSTISIGINNVEAIWNPFSCCGKADIDADKIMQNTSIALDKAFEVAGETIDTIEKINSLAERVSSNLEETGLISEATLKVIKKLTSTVNDGTNIVLGASQEIDEYSETVMNVLSEMNGVLADNQITPEEASALKNYLPDLLELVDKWDQTGDTTEQIMKIKATIGIVEKVIANSSSYVAPGNKA